MLQSVFKELYDQGVLIFLDVDNYVTNNTDIDVNIFESREHFLEIYTEPIMQGWIFCHTTNLDEVLKTIQEDTCCLIEFGFNSDTEEKALKLGRNLVDTFKKFKFMAQWCERVIKEHKVSIVVTAEDLPQAARDLIDEYEIVE